MGDGPQSALERLPDDVLFLILDHFDSARDVAHLEQTCKQLHQFMLLEGWRAFCRRCFPDAVSASRRCCGDNVDNGNNINGLVNHVEGLSLSEGGTAQGDAERGNGDASRSTMHTDGDVYANARPQWDVLADALTWQSRAWDRRAISFQGLMPRLRHIPRYKRPKPFRSSLAVHFQADLANGRRWPGLALDGEEMLVCGAGENLVARFRLRGRGCGAAGTGPSTPVWKVFDGQQAGFRPGFDDVCAVSVVENAMGRSRRRGILVGRDNGDVSLVSGEPDGAFGRVLARFKDNPRPEANGRGTQSFLSFSNLFSIDISTRDRNTVAPGSGSGSSSGRGGIAAVTTRSDILFYALPDGDYEGDHEYADGSDGRNWINGTKNADDIVTVHPLARLSMAGAGLGQPGKIHGVACNARWMYADGVLAFGTATGDSPLRYSTLTPTGPAALTAAYTPHSLLAHYKVDSHVRMIPSSLAPIPPSAVTGGNGHLVLSGWRDGICRLQDLRTASAQDLFYQDCLMGSLDCAAAILVWGAERFVTGNESTAALKIFDLRWPKPYFATDALSCSADLPFPGPPLKKGIDSASVTMAGPPPSGDAWRATVAAARQAPSFLDPTQRTPQNWPPTSPELPFNLPATARCVPRKDIWCRWHTASRDLVYRSSATLFLHSTLERNGFAMVGVTALANAAATDQAPANFYAGLYNGVVEAFLHEAYVPVENLWPHGRGRWRDGDTAPYFGYPKIDPNSAASRGGHYETVDLDVPLMETGDSMAHANVEQAMRLPRFRSRSRAASASRGWMHESTDRHTVTERQHHRLDYGLQDDVDFVQPISS